MTSISNKEYPLIFAGEEKKTNDLLIVKNKFNNEDIGNVYLASKEDVKYCFDKANEHCKTLANTTPGERAEILQTLHTLINERFDEFADLIMKEAGKPINQAKGEVKRCLCTLDEAIKEASLGSPDGTWREHAGDGDRNSILIRRFPVGVASFITPFNFPLNLVVSFCEIKYFFYYIQYLFCFFFIILKDA